MIFTLCAGKKERFLIYVKNFCEQKAIVHSVRHVYIYDANGCNDDDVKIEKLSYQF